MMKIKFTKEEINWIERTADIESSRIFQQFNRVLEVYQTQPSESKILLDKQISELMRLYDFLKTLRSKLELWDSRYGIEEGFEIPDKEQSPSGDGK